MAVEAAFAASLRLAAFLGVLAVLLVWETVQPLRKGRAVPRHQRWPGAFVLVVAGTVLMRLAAPLGLTGWALWLDANDVGVLRWVAAAFAGSGSWGAVWTIAVWLLSLLVLDLAVWAQHVASHRIGWFWRLHRVHHADPDLDASTALRFHPIESLLSLGWKAAVVAAIGAPATAVLAFEILLNAAALFNHANIRLAEPLERVLGRILITPRQHRVHHSLGTPDPAQRSAADVMHNFGFSISLWDRLAGTFRAEPTGGLNCARYGLAAWRGAADQSPLALLAQPFCDPPQTDASASDARTSASIMPGSRLE